ncbi:MAG: polyprenyl synthetase family protein [Deltaproteobacteria bacterium]|jgi:octaprenyl-diphosphate synthase|nr:polyprenyl synthetase family protein [Deltaproteobacteria bacterium]
MNDFLDHFSPHLKEIDDALNQSLGTRVPVVADIVRYSLLGAGKRIRPLLFVLSSHLCGYKGEDVYRLSTLFEYVHAASLVHDDVLDNADLRRRKPSVRQVWGNAAAVLGGDFLYSAASAIAVECRNLELIRLLSDLLKRMVEGQFLELEHTHNWKISKAEYMEIITAKTAALMRAACNSGAMVAGADEKTVQHLGDFGSNLGIAFQLMDDLLDYTSSEEVFGKPVGKDLKEGKITLPLVYFVSELERAEVERLAELFKSQKASDQDYQDLVRRVRVNGAIERVRSEASEYVARAGELLKLFPDSPVKQGLLELGGYILTRRH